MVSLKVFVYSKEHSAHSENRDGECVKRSLTRGLKQWKLLTVRPKKWSRSLTEGGRLLEGYNCKTSTGKIWVFWIGGRLWEVVARERWSHMEVRLYLRASLCKILISSFAHKMDFAHNFSVDFF